MMYPTKYMITGTFCDDQYAPTRREAVKIGAAMARAMSTFGRVTVLRRPSYFGSSAYAEIVAEWRVPGNGGRTRRQRHI